MQSRQPNWLSHYLHKENILRLPLLLLVLSTLSACATTSSTAPPSLTDPGLPATTNHLPPKVSKPEVEKEVAQAFERSNWTSKEKLAFTISTTGHVLDLTSSVLSDERCVERNPILGHKPTNAQLALIKVAAISLEYWLYNSPRFAHYDTYIYGITSGALHILVAMKNLSNDCYR